MRRPIIDVDPRLILDTRVDWEIDWRNVRSAENVVGLAQTVAGPQPRFVGTRRLFLHRDTVARWRALRATARGMAGVFRMEMLDPVTWSPWTAARGTVEGGVAWSNGLPWRTGAGWRWNPFVVALSDVSAGDTLMTVQIESGASVPVVGQRLSYADRPFEVTAVTPAATVDVYDLHVAALRVDIPPGGLVQLRATGLFELVSDLGGRAPYDASLVSRPTFELREVLD